MPAIMSTMLTRCGPVTRSLGKITAKIVAYNGIDALIGSARLPLTRLILA